MTHSETLFTTDNGYVPTRSPDRELDIPAELLFEAQANAPDRPWGHLMRFPSLEPVLKSLGRDLLNSSRISGTAQLALQAQFDDGPLPGSLLGTWSHASFAFPQGEVADAIAAAITSAALTWEAMTGNLPSGMRGWIAVAHDDGAARRAHFDNDDGSVVITLAGATTWLAVPENGSVRFAQPLVPLAVPGRNARNKGGMLHGVLSEPERVVAVFRSSMSGKSGRKPSSRAREIEFDRDNVRHLVDLPAASLRP